jgi:hypothetical protein
MLGLVYHSISSSYGVAFIIPGKAKDETERDQSLAAERSGIRGEDEKALRSIGCRCDCEGVNI